MNRKTGTELSDEQVTDIVKKRNRKKSEDMMPQYEPGDMTRMISDAINLSSFGPIDVNDTPAVEERIKLYLSYCMEHDMKPSVESMALAFNTNRTQLWRWANGVECNVNEASRNTIKKGYSIMNQLLTQTMMDGRINPVSAIFLLKNNMNYRDQTDVVVTPNNPLQDLDADAARKRLMESVPDEEDE